MKKSLLIILILLLFITGCGKNKNDKLNDLVNDNAKLIDEVKVDNFIISDLSIVYDKGSSINATVTNTSNKQITIKFVNIRLFDIQNNEVLNVNAYVGNKFNAKETKELNLEASDNLLKVVRAEYRIIY